MSFSNIAQYFFWVFFLLNIVIDALDHNWSSVVVDSIFAVVALSRYWYYYNKYSDLCKEKGIANPLSNVGEVVIGLLLALGAEAFFITSVQNAFDAYATMVIILNFGGAIYMNAAATKIHQMIGNEVSHHE